MKTKIVYTVASDDSDIYLEQTYVSICSLRKFHPDATVVLVVDDNTDKTIKGIREYILGVITHKIVVVPPHEYTKVERSRYLKTTLRNQIEGEYLFIDSDTLITADLSEVDNFEDEICAVIDYHVPLDKHVSFAFIKRQASTINWIIEQSDFCYFNSGVMYVKDTDTTRKLYSRWNEEWTTFRKNTNFPVPSDQPTLGKVNKEMGYVIEEMDGEWNCQIAANGLRFLDRARIIHYFSSTIKKGDKEPVYALMNNNVFLSLKEKGILDETLSQMIASPKTLFAERLVLISGEAMDIYYSHIVKRVISTYRYHRKTYEIINNLCKKWMQWSAK